MDSSDLTHTTHAYCSTTEQQSSSMSITPFHLAVDMPREGDSPNCNNKSCCPNDGTAGSVTSRLSLSSTTDGIDVLGAAESPRNFREWSQLQAARVVSDVLFKRAVLAFVLVTCALLGVRTFLSGGGSALRAVNAALHGLLVLCTLEVLVSATFCQEHLLSSGWLLFDIALLVLCWHSNDTTLLVLRGFRLLRALRKASGVPALKWAVKAVLRVLPRFLSVVGILLPGMFAIFAILFTNLYGDADDFRRLDVSALTLFQIMTAGRSWSDLVGDLSDQYRLIWLPTILFVVVAVFFSGSLIIAIMCDAVSHVYRDRFWKALDGTPTTDNRNNHESQSSAFFFADMHNNSSCGADGCQQDLRRLERKIDELNSTVETLVRIQATMQESLVNNGRCHRDASRQEKIQLASLYESKATVSTVSSCDR
jgi:Ion transport protein